MKNLAELPEKQALKIAYRFIYSTDYIFLNKSFPRKRSLDMTFTVNKLAANFIRKMRLTQPEIIKIREKRRKRAISRQIVHSQISFQIL